MGSIWAMSIAKRERVTIASLTDESLLTLIDRWEDTSDERYFALLAESARRGL
jgi:hypothetical protein